MVKEGSVMIKEGENKLDEQWDNEIRGFSLIKFRVANSRACFLIKFIYSIIV